MHLKQKNHLIRETVSLTKRIYSSSTSILQNEYSHHFLRVQHLSCNGGLSRHCSETFWNCSQPVSCCQRTPAPPPGWKAAAGQARFPSLCILLGLPLLCKHSAPLLSLVKGTARWHFPKNSQVRNAQVLPQHLAELSKCLWVCSSFSKYFFSPRLLKVRGEKKCFLSKQNSIYWNHKENKVDFPEKSVEEMM